MLLHLISCPGGLRKTYSTRVCARTRLAAIGETIIVTESPNPLTLVNTRDPRITAADVSSTAVTKKTRQSLPHGGFPGKG
jgi:hypothetical protein